MVKKVTLIKVSEETKKILIELKIIPRESYDGVIRRLINKYEENNE